MTIYLFYFLSFLAILCGLMVILEKNPIHSVLYLVITFFAIAGHYILLNAQFLAAVHIIVYAGAIMVLFLIMIAALRNTAALPAPQEIINADMGLVKNLGKVLFTQFLLPFEIASILFLAAMVGAVMLGKRDIK